jgi:hypothetical protein
MAKGRQEGLRGGLVLFSEDLAYLGRCGAIYTICAKTPLNLSLQNASCTNQTWPLCLSFPTKWVYVPCSDMP